MSGWDWLALLIVGSLLIEHYMDWKRQIELEKHKMNLESQQARKDLK